VPPGNLYYIAGSFGNPEIVKVVSDQEVFDCPRGSVTPRESMCARKNSMTVLNTTNVSHLDPQFTGVCHLLIKINHICIRGFDNDPALLSQFFETFVSM
jgi:hypothetical protein